jgi:hypothetical protein
VWTMTQRATPAPAHEDELANSGVMSTFKVKP